MSRVLFAIYTPGFSPGTLFVGTTKNLALNPVTTGSSAASSATESIMMLYFAATSTTADTIAPVTTAGSFLILFTM